MKTYWKILAAAAACMAFATACNNDDDGNDTPGLNGDITPGTTLTGNITSDATLTEGNTYRLSGGLHVKAGATLRIEPGVEVIAVDDEIPDYILIEQGAKIDAQGTAAEAGVVQRFNGGSGSGIFHFNKTKTTGAPGFTVVHQLHGEHVAIGGKKVLNLLFGGGPGKIPDINRLGHEKNLTQKKSETHTLHRQTDCPECLSCLSAMPQQEGQVNVYLVFFSHL